MKQLAIEFFLISCMKRWALCVAVCVTILIGMQQNVVAQWQQATGFSNVNGGTPPVDAIRGFVVWGPDVLADASCGLDLTQGPGPTPDSLFLSTDNGKTWTSFGPNGGMPLIATPMGSGTALIGGAEPSTGDNQLSDEVLSISTDDGQTWAADTTGWNMPGGNGQAYSLITMGSSVFAQNSGGVYQQTAGGTWTVDTNGIGLLFGGVSSIGPVATVNNDLFLCTIGKNVLLSTNQGASWAPANNGLPDVITGLDTEYWPAWDLVSSGSAMYTLVVADTTTDGFLVYTSNNVYRTVDNGESWNRMTSAPITTWGNIHAMTASGNYLFMAADSGFYASVDDGATWLLSEQGLQLTQGDFPTSIQIFGGNVIIGTVSSNAWYRPLTDFAPSAVNPTPAGSASLFIAVSENPVVSSMAQVIYSLPDAGIARITLMNPLGQNVCTLQSGWSVSGQHTVTLNTRSITAGTYFVRLAANGESAMQKLIIAP